MPGVLKLSTKSPPQSSSGVTPSPKCFAKYLAGSMNLCPLYMVMVGGVGGVGGWVSE